MNNCFFALVGVDAVEDDANEDDVEDVEDVDAKADEDLKRDEEEI